MQALSEALDRLLDDGNWFVREQESRLLVVRTTGDTRSPALELLRGLEFHADNFSPWIVLEDPRTADDDGWIARTVRLVASWEERREAFLEKEDIELGEVPPPALPETADEAPQLNIFERLLLRSEPPPTPTTQAVAEVFAPSLQAVGEALREPLQGVVLILAPVVVDDSAAFGAELLLLLQTASLDFCRYVLVLDEGSPVPRQLVDGLDKEVIISDCRVDPSQVLKDLDAMLANSGPEGTTDQVGVGAGPRGVKPPPRIDDPPEVPVEKRDEALREAGVNPALLEAGPRLQYLLLGASVAMAKGRGAEAIRLQREARDLAGQLEMVEMQLTCQMALASYLSGLDRRDLALAEIDGALKIARANDLQGPLSQALLARGLLLMLEKKQPEAAHDYVLSGRAAERAGEPLLAIEGYRMAGHLAEQLRARAQAVTCYREALRVAEDADVDLVQLSSASEVAQRLAEVMEKQKKAAQARVLAEQARRINLGMVGVGAGAMTEKVTAMSFDEPVSGEDEIEESDQVEPEEAHAPRSLEAEVYEELLARTQALPAYKELSETDLGTRAHEPPWQGMQVSETPLQNERVAATQVFETPLKNEQVAETQLFETPLKGQRIPEITMVKTPIKGQRIPETKFVKTPIKSPKIAETRKVESVRDLPAVTDEERAARAKVSKTVEISAVKFPDESTPAPRQPGRTRGEE